LFFQVPDGLFDKIRESKDDEKEGLPDFELVGEIPGLKLGGWTSEEYQELRKSKERSFLLQCQNIIEMMRKHKSCWPFLEAVNKDDVPDYYEVIKDPIDLKTMEKRLIANYYIDKDVFVKDIGRIFANCKTYNLPETIYYKAANELEEFVNPYLITLKDDQVRNAEREKAEKTAHKGPGVKKRIKKDK